MYILYLFTLHILSICALDRELQRWHIYTILYKHLWHSKLLNNLIKSANFSIALCANCLFAHDMCEILSTPSPKNLKTLNENRSRHNDVDYFESKVSTTWKRIWKAFLRSWANDNDLNINVYIVLTSLFGCPIWRSVPSKIFGKLIFYCLADVFN